MQDAQDFIDSVKKFNKNSVPSTPQPVSSPSDKNSQKEAGEPHQPESEGEEPVNYFSPLRAVPTKTSFNRNSLFPTKPFDFRKEAITFIETFYFKHNCLPNKADFANNFIPRHLPKTDQEFQEVLLDLSESLENRGIPIYDTPLTYLEPHFVLAVNLITNPYDKRNIPAKLKEAGLTTKQWNGFLRKPIHQEYYKERVNQIFDEDTQLNAKLALQRLIEAGDLQAIKHFHELQNIYRPQNNGNQQILVILQAIMEILSMHVSPEILGRVAQDIKSSPLISLGPVTETKAS